MDIEDAKVSPYEYYVVIAYYAAENIAVGLLAG